MVKKRVKIKPIATTVKYKYKDRIWVSSTHLQCENRKKKARVVSLVNFGDIYDWYLVKSLKKDDPENKRYYVVPEHRMSKR